MFLWTGGDAISWFGRVSPTSSEIVVRTRRNGTVFGQLPGIGRIVMNELSAETPGRRRCRLPLLLHDRLSAECFRSGLLRYGLQHVSLRPVTWTTVVAAVSVGCGVQDETTKYFFFFRPITTATNNNVVSSIKTKYLCDSDLHAYLMLTGTQSMFNPRK